MVSHAADGHSQALRQDRAHLRVTALDLLMVLVAG